jgi:apolipoprotein N-acyltransferase
MQVVVSSLPTSNPHGLADIFARLHRRAPAIIDFGVATLSAVLLILSFPDFNLWPLAWCALVPLLVLLATTRGRWRPFFLGWVFGTVFFYGSCYWVTYSMIHTGGISPLIAYGLLIPGAVLLGVFLGLFGLFLARAIRKWGTPAVLLGPVFWAALEWLRLEVTGQLWNAIGYSQAFRPSLIAPARWGGVFAVGAVIVFVNSAIAFPLLRRTKRTLWVSAVAVLLAYVVLLIVNVSMAFFAGELVTKVNTEAVVIAIQPNVPMDLVKSNDDMKVLTARHFEMTEKALKQIPNGTEPRLVIWPESPMNFGYGGDAQMRSTLASFAQQHQVSILLNSQETAPNDGVYNSAVLVNEQGKLVAQYDKIRLLPFGEYVPLPNWVPGAGLIRAIVGDFTAGTHYQLMPVGNLQAGVFICIESAYPSIARRFTNEGADVLINISNDGYLGPTAVMRQHLANAVFRAVENGRPVLSVTNTGITAFVEPNGETKGATTGFKPEIRIWSVSPPPGGRTFYTKHGDLFVISCAVLSLVIFVFTFVGTAGKARRL